jgi:two-component system sensor histidine kinase/response regulator
MADENKLRQVLVNLLGNAAKFTERGGIVVRIRCQAIGTDGPRLRFEVEDTGPGISPEDMGKLFQHFGQGSAGISAESGTGLGLSISREFVRLMGGEISVSSQVGKGSVFSFEIPVAESDERAALGNTDSRRVIGLQPGQPRYRILIADDAVDNRELLVQLLGPVGFDLRAVVDGKEALREFRSWRPHLILLDIRMPEVDGYEVMRTVRAGKVDNQVKIIAVTASAFAEMRDEVLRAGADEFVAKPFREQEVFEKIASALGLEYVYEATVPETGPENVLDADALGRLDPQVIVRLREAALLVDFRGVQSVIDEIAVHDERAAKALRAMADRFDADAILDALPDGD